MRPYIVFGSNDDGKTLTPLGIYEAADHDAARKMARGDTAYTSYGSTPVGNWSFGRLNVKQVVEIEEIPLTWENGKQLTVDDVVKKPDPFLVEDVDAEDDGP